MKTNYTAEEIETLSAFSDAYKEEHGVRPTLSYHSPESAAEYLADRQTALQSEQKWAKENPQWATWIREESQRGITAPPDTLIDTKD